MRSGKACSDSQPGHVSRDFGMLKRVNELFQRVEGILMRVLVNDNLMYFFVTAIEVKSEVILTALAVFNQVFVQALESRQPRAYQE